MKKKQQGGVFHAGTNYEPLLGEKTRIRRYAEGGELLSEEIVSSDEALRRLEAAVKARNAQAKKGH